MTVRDLKATVLKKDFSSLRLWFHVEFLFYTVTTCHNGFDLFIDVVHGSELTGQEDPLFLYPIISCWTSNTAYREGRMIGIYFSCKGCFTLESFQYKAIYLLLRISSQNFFLHFVLLYKKSTKT